MLSGPTTATDGGAEPDLADPTPSGALPEAPDPQRRRNKPGKQPTRDWHTVVAREVIRRAYAQPQQKKPTAVTMVKFCEKTIGYRPDPSDMRKWLKELF